MASGHQPPRRPGLIALLVALGGGLVGCHSGSPIPPSRAAHRIVAVEGVALLARSGPEILRDQTVVIEEGRITGVGRSGEVAIPPRALRIGGHGRYLMPGLADMHVHLEHFDDPRILALFVVNGVTTVRNMDGRERILDWRERVERGTLLGPRIHTAGPILEGEPPFWNDTRVVATPEAAAVAVGEQSAAGYDFVKVYHTLSPSAYRSVLGAADERGLQVAGHLPNGIDFEELLAGGQDSVEHLDGYLDVLEAEASPFLGRWHWRKLYMAVPIDTDRLPEVAARTATAGLWNCPTLVVHAQIGPPSELERKLADPRLALLPEHLTARWKPENFPFLADLDAADLAALEEGRRNRGRLVAALAEAGAGILAGSDTPNPFVYPGSSLHEELAHLVEAGLEPHQALAAATRAAAVFLGEEGSWGTVTVGGRADLLLLEANPLDDITNLTRIAGVLVAGRWLPAEELAAIERDLARR